MQETMTSRQRVAEAINHRVPDRMPIDLGMHTSTGISAFAYQNLRAHLGLPDAPVELVDGVQVTARVEETVLRRFHCDCAFLRPRPAKPRIWSPRAGYEFLVPDYCNPKQNDVGEWVVEQGARRMRMPVGGYFFDGSWLSMEDRWDDAFFAATVREAERLYKDTDYFTAFIGFHPFFESDVDFFCDMIAEPDELKAQNEKHLETQIALAGKLINSMKDHIGAVCLSGDLGGQQSPMVKPDVFADVSAPYLRAFCEFIHRHSDYKVFLHSCGSIEPLIPLLIDCGVDILNPVQISAQNMAPEMLKAKYGKDIVFWGGGVDTQRVMGFQPADAVAANAKALTQIFKPGGGYVFCPVHNIMGDVPPENVIAAYDSAYANSFYIN